MSLSTYSFAGVATGLLLGCASFTPSLAPRNWLWQGVVFGLSALAGYALGVFLGWVVHAASGWRPSAVLARRLWTGLAVVGVPLLAWSLWLGQEWQHEIHQLNGVEPPESYAWFRILVVGVVVFSMFLAVARGFRWVVRKVSWRLAPITPDWLAGPLAFLIVVLVLGSLNNGLMRKGFVALASSVFEPVNNSTDVGTSQPLTPRRSGSPASLIPWDSLGREGRNFVARAPGAEELSAFSGEGAENPVRVYAGLQSAETVSERAALAVEDLRRAGGFDREVLVVATSTGTGYVAPAAVEAVEYMYNGDTAAVSLQYSYLPSYLSLLVDSETAQEAGRELFDHVYEAWSQLPEGDRPELLVTGTSLGVFGSEAAFDDGDELVRRTDGVVWAGAPNFSPLRTSFVDERDPGSPEWRPVYDGGRSIRFISDPDDLDGAPGAADVAYLQNGSDPVVHWSPRLAFAKPDWLSEPTAPNVSPDMVWIPVVTFWQVTADLPSNYGVPFGYGHRYLGQYVDGWVAVAPPDGWSEEDSDRLRKKLRQLQSDREQLAELLGVDE
ncbi:MAG TPA: alpha/beta-hydrolase family protein [Nocardioidaceae bacterium]|nr:alpha/beta-hydrolase family protein [Nocardioidaceae bacterium]